jgi:CubicO group peptidase (beta-lactamase class C family)
VKIQHRTNRLAPAQFRELETIVEPHLGETFPALGLAVIHNDDWIIDAVWGWIDPETHQHPVQVDTLFDLASLTKLFTHTAFLQLVSAGKVELGDPLVSVIPEFGEGGARPLDGGQDPHTKGYLPTPEAVKGQIADPTQVTFRHLMTHTSGLAPWRDVYNAAGRAPTPPNEPDLIPRALRWANGLKAICGYPFVGQPGGTVRYSDLGVMLLGEAVARLHGTRDLAEVIRTQIREPLNLDSLVFNPARDGVALTMIAPTEDDPTWRNRRSWGEVHDENACGVGGVAGHAGLFARAADVARFGQAWLLRDQRLQIDPTLMDEAVSEQRHNGFRFGLGWMLKAHEDSAAGDCFSPNSYGHTGFTGTSLWIDPQKRVVVACLTNRVYAGRWKEGIHPFRRSIHDFFARRPSCA